MSIYHFLKSFQLLLEIFMNPPTSESFSLKHCKTVGNLTLLFKGLGLDPYFSQLCSFRFKKGLAEKTGPPISSFGTSALWKQQKFNDCFFHP